MKEALEYLVPLTLEAGLRFFIAERGHYGFITDAEGSKVMCFGLDGLRLNFGGNYRAVNRSAAKLIGQGWRIAECEWPENSEDIKNLFTQAGQPPGWATSGHAVKITSLETHLKDYQWSSKYMEVTA